MRYQEDGHYISLEQLLGYVEELGQTVELEQFY